MAEVVVHTGRRVRIEVESAAADRIALAGPMSLYRPCGNRPARPPQAAVGASQRQSVAVHGPGCWVVTTEIEERTFTVAR